MVVTDEKMSKNVTQDVFSFMMDAELLVKWMRSWQGCGNRGAGGSMPRFPLLLDKKVVFQATEMAL